MEEILSAILQNPEGASLMIAQNFEKVKPFIYDMGRLLLGVYGDFVGNDEYYEIYAKHWMNLYRHLLHVGFDQKQAMAILLSNKTDLKDLVSGATGSAKIKNN